MYTKLTGKRSVAEVIELYGAAAERALRPSFEAAGVNFPPARVALLAVKEDRQLELWAVGGPDDRWRLVKRYAVLGASGVLGPKLREGDRQVPEGVYRVVGLNPNSAYHLSMKLDYPNAFDLAWAGKEGRTSPGSDIFIHGKSASIGCLAMGDPAIEELFYLAHRVGIENIQVVIAPQDPRVTPLVPPASAPHWVGELYERTRLAFLQVASS
jgi:hypothetical protein